MTLEKLQMIDATPIHARIQSSMVAVVELHKMAK